MKTLRFFVILFFTTAFTVNNVNAQNGAYKQENTYIIEGWFCPCTGDYLFGTNVFVDVVTPNGNDITVLKDGIMYGYKDENGLISSGNVYEYSQVSPGSPIHGGWYQNTIQFRFNGKLIAEAHYSYRVITNANGVITVDRSTVKWNCK